MFESIFEHIFPISIPWVILGVSCVVGLLGIGYIMYNQHKTQKMVEQMLLEEQENDRKIFSESSYRQSLKDKSKEIDEDLDVVSLLGYDPASNSTISNFQPIQQKTHCLFAKSAKVWSSKEYDYNLTLEENVKENLESLTLFTRYAKGLHLDGFLFEIPGEDNNKDVESFGQSVRRVLTVINHECMNRSYIGKKGWNFEFQKESFFCDHVFILLPEEPLSIRVWNQR